MEERIAAYLEAGKDKDYFVEVKIENGNCRKKYIPTPVELEKKMAESINSGYKVFINNKSEDLKEAYEKVSKKFLSEDLPVIDMDLEGAFLNLPIGETAYVKKNGTTYKIRAREDRIYGCTKCGIYGLHLCHKVNCMNFIIFDNLGTVVGK